MQRRDLLTAAVALPALAVPVVAEAAETPVKVAYREWLAYRNWLNVGTDGIENDEFDELCDVRRDMEVVIYDMPSEGPEDILLKLLVLNDNGNDFSDDDCETGVRLLTEARALVGVTHEPS